MRHKQKLLTGTSGYLLVREQTVVALPFPSFLLTLWPK